MALVLYLSLYSSTIDEGGGGGHACKTSGARCCELSMQGNHDNPDRSRQSPLK